MFDRKVATVEGTTMGAAITALDNGSVARTATRSMRPVEGVGLSVVVE